MAADDDRLGGRLPLLARADLAPEQKALWDKMVSTMGSWLSRIGFESKTSDDRLIGPCNPMLRSPTIAQAFLYAQSLRCFGEQGLVDFKVLAGCYDLVCRLRNLFAVPAP